MATVGLGDTEPQLAVYIANRPGLTEYQALAAQRPLLAGEIACIGQACGNGWRKVFNVYAKLLFALRAAGLDLVRSQQRWQHYRDHRLLQQGSGTALQFSAPMLGFSRPRIQIICGRTYANLLDEQHGLGLQWLDRQFAVQPTFGLFVCPYFDYRQLSDCKILHLVELITCYQLKQPTEAHP
ncbi:hypothetical protein J0A66_08035 [Bowmanella dokdonensis]|uniref:Uncharacterized protein n=1 Tax=Bowmanella dokdonensis TaxID=751969 RepID=A0A939IQL3_9ALTE|nr:hypothetical protein [Bowmanella dokdonensis]